MTTVRLLPFASAAGPVNMAADEVLFEGALAGEAALRFYTWDSPTISLGYFQPATAAQVVHRWEKLTIVRRATGGATLLHHSELTYALALPAGPQWQPRSKPWICRMHTILMTGLGQFDIESNLVACDAERKLGESLCFLHQTTGDLLLNGHKIGGSAQRKSRGALLQHGAILLARSPYTPELPGVRELTGSTLFSEALLGVIQEAIQHETGWALEKSDWRPVERQRIEELTTSRYANPEWTLKR